MKEKELNTVIMMLGKLARKRFDQYNEETEYGFRVRIERLLAEDLRKVKVRRVSEDLEVVEMLE